MPRPEHFLPTVADWPAVRALWLDWIQGKRPDLKNMQELAIAANAPLATLNKKTARWKREEAAKIDEQLKAFKVTRGPRKQAEPSQAAMQAIGRGRKEGINAFSPSSPPLFSDAHRAARQIGKDAMSEAMSALVEEVQRGTGASRVAAVKLLLEKAGLASDLDKKDEVSPYEGEDVELLKARLKELLGSIPAILSEGPHHLETGPSSGTITPSPSAPVVPAELPGGPVGDVAAEAALGNEVEQTKDLVVSQVKIVLPWTDVPRATISDGEAPSGEDGKAILPEGALSNPGDEPGLSSRT